MEIVNSDPILTFLANGRLSRTTHIVVPEYTGTSIVLKNGRPYNVITPPSTIRKIFTYTVYTLKARYVTLKSYPD